MEQVDDATNKSMLFSAFCSMARRSNQPQKAKSEQPNKYGTEFQIPDLARDPYVVRTGCSVVDYHVAVSRKHLSRETLMKAIEQTPAVKVGQASLAPQRAYNDRDDLPLATEQQKQDWSVAYEALAFKARAQHNWPVGGRLVHFVEEWRSIGCSRRVLRWLAKGYKLPFVPAGQAQALACRRPSCPKQLRIHYSDPVKARALEKLIRTLLEKHVIEEIAINANVFHCLLFLRPKPNGKWRAITDVSPLNELLNVKKFKMDTPQVIRQALTTDLWATSVDFSDAYHHIPIHPSHKQFLAFQVGQRKFLVPSEPLWARPTSASLHGDFYSRQGVRTRTLQRHGIPVPRRLAAALAGPTAPGGCDPQVRATVHRLGNRGQSREVGVSANPTTGSSGHRVELRYLHREAASRKDQEVTTHARTDHQGSQGSPTDARVGSRPNSARSRK